MAKSRVFVGPLQMFDFDRIEASQAREERMSRKARIRAMTRGHEQKPCAACGASKLISVQHHVHLVASSSPEDPNCTRYVWLCPNCHATIHILERKGTDANLEDLFDELIGEGLLDGDKGRVLADIFIEMVAAAEAKGDA